MEPSSASASKNLAAASAFPTRAVILPALPGSPSDHQARNAQTLERAGAAVVVRDEECDPARLDRVVSDLLREPEQLVAMGNAARALGRPDAAARVADLVEEHARAA